MNLNRLTIVAREFKEIGRHLGADGSGFAAVNFYGAGS